jgi:hypothetical protein
VRSTERWLIVVLLVTVIGLYVVIGYSADAAIDALL